jgi:hypothetical protein
LSPRFAVEMLPLSLTAGKCTFDGTCCDFNLSEKIAQSG